MSQPSTSNSAPSYSSMLQLRTQRQAPSMSHACDLSLHVRGDVQLWRLPKKMWNEQAHMLSEQSCRRAYQGIKCP